MSAAELSAPPSPLPAANTKVPITTHPLLGVCGVLLGALIATATGRLISVGLADLRGAMHLGVDEASWIGTTFNAGLMFIGPFSVYLGGLLGPRRVLLFSGAIFTVVSTLLPYAPGLPELLLLVALAGLTAGTFYPMTLSFVLRGLPIRYVLLGIAMYASDIVFTTNVATSLEAWLTEHLSWRWIFWSGAALAPPMIILIYFGIPWQALPTPAPDRPRPNWRGFLYGSLGFALLYVAFDQGERLDWWRSGTVVACAAAGAFLLLAGIVRHLLLPNPMINFRFLLRRNTALLSVILVIFRFSILATVVVIPNFLGTVQGYRPQQTGPVLIWVALPQIVAGLFAMYLLRRVDPRLILASGFGLVALACLLNSHLDSAWYGGSFSASQLVLSCGLAFAFNAMVGSLILELINTGALKRPIDVLTFSGFFQTVRLFGGELGSTAMLHFIQVREHLHSNVIGQFVHQGAQSTNQRLLGLRAGMLIHTTDMGTAIRRAGALLGLQVREQAFTLAIADSFLLLTAAALCCLFVVACMARVPTQFQQVIAAPGESK